MEQRGTSLSELTSVEQIAVDQADIMESMAKMIQTLITELAQYRRMDEEEKQLEALVKRMGGGSNEC